MDLDYLPSVINRGSVSFFQSKDAFVSSESEEKRFFITQNITKVGSLTITVASALGR